MEKYKDVQEADPQPELQLLILAPLDIADISEYSITNSDDLIVPSHPQDISEQLNNDQESHSIPGGFSVDRKTPSQHINLNPYDTNLIITGKRNRRQAPNPNVFAIQTFVITLGFVQLKTYLYTFAARFSKQNIPE